MSKIIRLTPYLLFIFLGYLFFPAAGRDDVHITYWAAYTLSRFGEILNYSGCRVEQSSSLLHTLLLAIIHKGFNGSFATIGGLCSIFFGLLTIFLAGRLSAMVGLHRKSIQFFVATVVLFVYWSFGALETSLVSAIVLFLLISTIYFEQEQSLYSYLIYAFAVFLYLLARPEAFFVMCAFFGLLFFLSKLSKEKVGHFIYLFATLTFLLLIITSWRYSYFSSIFPQPVSAKIDVSLTHKIYSGLTYFQASIEQYPLLLLLIFSVFFVLFRACLKYRMQRGLVVIVSFVFAYLMFVLTSGGDWMEGGRFFVPVIAPLVILLFACLPTTRAKMVGMIGGGINCALLILFAMHYSTSYPIFFMKDYEHAIIHSEKFSFFEVANRVHLRDIPLVVEMKNIMAKAISAGVKPKIMSSQSGMVPFYIFQDYYNEAEFVDLLGVTSRDFTNCRLTKKISHNSFGIQMTYEFFFENLAKFTDECGIPKPDIVYDLDNAKLDRVHLLEKYGYDLVYLQTGNVGQGGIFKGMAVGGTQFIVLRSELASRLKLTKREFNFNI